MRRRNRQKGISIHTTAKVVTIPCKIRVCMTFISIHTTAKVVTIASRQQEIDSQHFNPHHREGGDGKITEKQNICTISIHTTAKVVTAKMPKFHSYFCIKLLINRLFHTNLTTPFPSIPPFPITQHPKIWCESPNVFLFTSYSH